MGKKLTIGDWLEFIASGIPLIDWYYAVNYKATKVEKVLFPKFIKRPQKDWIVATVEHFVYFILGFCFVFFISLDWSMKVGALAIFVVIPLEFLYFKWKVPLFKGLSWKKLLITALWNMFNVILYWLAGCAVAFSI